MKKGFIVLLTCLAFHTGYGQEGLKVGIKLNPLIAFARQTDADGNEDPRRSNDTRIGWVYGITGDYYLAPNYGFHSGIHVVAKGYSEVFARDTLPNSDQNVRISSIEIPFTALLRSNELGNGLFLKGFFGLSLDMNVGYNNKYEGSNPISGEVGDGSVKGANKVKGLGFSFVVGPGIDWELGGVGTLGLGVTYHQGLTNVNRKKNTNNENTIRANYISLDVDYFF